MSGDVSNWPLDRHASGKRDENGRGSVQASPLLMDSSLSILGAIAFVLFHSLVSLPLATLTARGIVVPWLRAQGVSAGDAPEWAVVVGLLVLMSVAFALRGHVIAASGARHAGQA